MNVWENIALPVYIQGKKDREVEERVTDLLNLVDLTDKAHLFPGQLSGGEAQRVSIARALACGPKIIFADEPTGNLDAEASLSITRLLKKINKLGTTLLFATHDNLVLQELAKEKIVKLEKKIKELEKTNDKQIEQLKEIKSIHFQKTKIEDKEEKIKEIEDKEDIKVIKPIKDIKKKKKIKEKENKK